MQHWLGPIYRAYQYRDHYAKLHQGMVIGYLSSDVPEELILAAGAFPLRLSGEKSGRTPFADEYLKPGFNPVARGIFEHILDGTYKFLDTLIFSNLDESLVRLFYLTREIQRFGFNDNIPDYYFFEFLHFRSETSLKYNVERLRELKYNLENWTGRRIRNSTLWEAIKLCNENRQLLVQIAELRQRVLLSGSESLQIIGAAMFMPKDEHNRMLRQLLLRSEQLQPKEGKVRLYIEGSSLDDLAFYEWVESCNALIVGENSDWGNRYFDGLTKTYGDPIQAIVERYLYSAPHPSKSSISQRVEYCLKQVEATQADGVIFVMYEGEHPPHWDYPEQQKALHARGIPTLCLEWQSVDITQHAGQAVVDFVQSIKKGLHQ